MNFLDSWLTKLGKISRVKIDLYSLQLRLILGMVGILFLGLSSLTMWTAWEMEQFLIVTHQQKVEAIANRFLQDVKHYSATLPMETGLQQAIEQRALPDLWMWVKRADGKMMTQSKALTISPTDFQTVPMSIKQIPSKFQVYKVNGRQIVQYSGTLQVDSKTMGQLYIEQDITHDFRRLWTVLESLRIATLISLVAIALVFSVFIWRSLLPLRQMSQWMRTHTAPLNPYQINLNQAPSEVKQLAQEWNRLLAHLSLRRKQQRQFTNNIAHELRTPLSLVYGYLQRTLRRSNNLTTSQQEALSIAASQTEQTIQLLQDLINLARADSGSMPFRLEALVLNNLIVDLVRMTEKFEHRTIEIEAEPLPVKVKADREALMQVLTHLSEFDNQSLAISEVKEFESKLKYHQTVELEIIKHQITKTKVIYKISCELVENQEVIVERQRQAGRFILATNILEVQELNADKLLKIYKQQQSCERGFRFIKDPLFFADSLFVKNPERVETMMMLMGLCLESL